MAPIPRNMYVRDKPRSSLTEADPSPGILVQDIAKERRRKATEHEESELEAKQRGRSSEPSVVPPGFEEWKTCA